MIKVVSETSRVISMNTREETVIALIITKVHYIDNDIRKCQRFAETSRMCTYTYSMCP